jgi:hypothetical protein
LIDRQSGRSLSHIKAEPSEDGAGRRLCIGECPNLRRQIPVLVFGFLKSFEVIWGHLVANCGNVKIVACAPARSDVDRLLLAFEQRMELAERDICGSKAASQIKEQ